MDSRRDDENYPWHKEPDPDYDVFSDNFQYDEHRNIESSTIKSSHIESVDYSSQQDNKDTNQDVFIIEDSDENKDEDENINNNFNSVADSKKIVGRMSHNREVEGKYCPIH